MTRRAGAALVLTAAVLAGGRRASADLDLAVGNGDVVRSELSPATETETFHVDLVAGSRLTVAANPVRLHGARGPGVSIVVRDGTGLAVAAGTRHGGASKVAAFAPLATGAYSVVVTGDGVRAGAYSVGLSWTGPRGVRSDVTLAGAPVVVGFTAEPGTTAAFSVRAARRSNARPRLVDVRTRAGDVVQTFPAPPDAASRTHSARGVVLPEDVVDFDLTVADAGTGGAAAVRVDLRAPPVRKRRFDVTDAVLGTSDSAGGEVLGGVLAATGGTLSADAPGPITGAAVAVPAGALASPVAIVIGRGASFPAPGGALAGGGPAVYFGPAGLQFDHPVMVTIPFDATALAGDFTALRVYRREADGTVALVPTSTYAFDAAAHTVTFPVSGFTAFRVFAPVVDVAETAPLLPSDAAAGQVFGTGVAVDGATAIVGAAYDAAGGAQAGAAYAFVRTGGVWAQQQKLTAIDAAAGQRFGAPAAVEGDTAVLGAPGDATNGASAGAAYVFVRNGTTWTQQQKLVASDAAASAYFGSAVAISGQTIVVGAGGEAHAGANSGAAYVFTRNGTVWTEQAKLTASDAAADDEFAYSADVDGDTAVLGAPRTYGTGGKGAAYVFTRSGTTWTQQQKLRAADVADSDEFAISVAVSKDTVLAGSYQDSDAGTASGSAYVFDRSGAAWTQTAKLVASDAAANEWFGVTVALEGDTAVASVSRAPGVAANPASAIVFRRAGGEWTERARVGASTAAPADGALFHVVAVSGATVVDGAALANVSGAGSGAAYVYELK